MSANKMRSSSELSAPNVDLTKWRLSEISPTKTLSFSDSPSPEVDLTKWELTHHNDVHREVLVHVDRGEVDVVEI